MTKVLVVEDCQELRSVLKISLRIQGHEMVLEADTLPKALDALTMIKELGVKVAIIDDAFPDPGDGAVLAAVLRNRAPCVKVISFVEDDPQMWGDENIVKPGGFEKLGQAIGKVLSVKT